MSFGKRVRQEREKRGLTQADLAKALDVATPTIAEYEADKKKPRPEKLIILAKKLGVSTDYLLGINDRTKKEPINLMDALREEELPHIDGIPIDEETAKFLYIQLRALKEKLLEEMKEKKTKKKISA